MNLLNILILHGKLIRKRQIQMIIFFNLLFSENDGLIILFLSPEFFLLLEK